MNSASHFYQLGQVEPDGGESLVEILLICITLYIVFIIVYKIYEKMKRRERG